MSQTYSSGSGSLPSPIRPVAKPLLCPYVPGATFTAYCHQPPAPFGYYYSRSQRPGQEEFRGMTRLEWCIAHPPAKGSTDFGESQTFTISSTIRAGHDVGAQLVLTDTGLVAKIYDPLFYPFEDEDFQGMKIDVSTDADLEYSIEAAAYSELQGTSVEGIITSQYHGS